MAYARLGDEPRAQLATAERYALLGNTRLAVASAEAAMTRIPRGTPDYIRAEDIALAARAQAGQRRR
jgi:predicted Zn-dependent protease